jgi:hypothetical protein
VFSCGSAAQPAQPASDQYVERPTAQMPKRREQPIQPELDDPVNNAPVFFHNTCFFLILVLHHVFIPETRKRLVAPS